jgi:hypothetical protein
MSWDRGALLLQIVCARSSFEPHRGEDPDGRLFDRKPAGHAGGRHFVSYPVRDPETLRTSRNAHPQSQAGTSGAATAASSEEFGDTPGPSCGAVLAQWDLWFPDVDIAVAHDETARPPAMVGWRATAG